MASPESRKKDAAIIVAGMPSPDKLNGKPSPMDEDAMDGGADDDMEAKDAAEESAFADFRTAMAGKDDKAGVAALKEFLDACGYTQSE